MSHHEEMKNAERFTGFASVYDASRPAMPRFSAEIIERYLGRRADTVVDLGCGTGLSTLIWKDRCREVIGVEPSDEMRAKAEEKKCETIRFVKGFSHEIPLADESADIVVCSQSFHWMEPFTSLREVERILKPGGVFATVDCDWPPVSDWRVEKEYDTLFRKVHEIETTHPGIKDSFVRYDKNHHLENIRKSGEFRYVRELVFANEEKSDAERLIRLAFSQGSLQAILKREPALIEKDTEHFRQCVYDRFGDATFSVYFSYRMRIGVK